MAVKGGGSEVMRLANCFIFVMMLTVFTARGADSPLPTPNELLNGLGFSGEQIRAVSAGEIVAIDLPTVRDNQLKGAVAMRVPASIDRAAEFFMSERRLSVDTTVGAFGVLRPSANSNDWQAIGFGPEDRKEVRKVLEIRPVSILNLSPGEAGLMRNRLSQVTADQPGASNAVSKVYADILAGRYRAYLERGLEGMAPYVRGRNRTTSPAEEIRAHLNASSFSVLQQFPEFRRAVLDFPENQPPGIENTFYWIRATVEGRPHYALAHQMTTLGDGYLLVYSRDYFAGHTYNTLQSTFVWLADDQGLFGVHVNAGTTDEITGLFGGVARQVGKDRMKSDLIDNFTEVRKQLTQ